MAGGSGQADSGQQQSNGASPWQQAALRGSRARSPASSGRGSGGGGGRAARSSTAGGRFVRKDHPPREFEGPSSDFEIPSAKAFGADFGGEYELSTAHATQNQQLGEPELQDARSTIAGVKSQYGTASPDETASSENHKLPDQTSNVGYLSSTGADFEKNLAAVRAEIARLSAVESELQRHVDERSENCRLKEELAEKAAQIAELTEERSSFKASVESERRSLVAQVQEKELEIERLHNQLWGKEEAIRERDARLMEQGKKQSESDSSMAAAMENLSTQQQLWHSQEEDLKKEIAANEAKFKERESELLSMLNEWQRAVRGKEEAIWHVQAMHSAEKNSMEAHFLNQINILLTEKHALAEELQQLKGGSLGIKEAPTVTSERVTVSAPAVMPPSYSMPVLSQIPYLHVQPAPRPPGPHPTLAADSGVMLQPQAAPAAQAQEPSRQPQQSPGLNWIESLMNGTAHLHASNVPAGDRSVPDVQADVQGSNAHGQEESWAHHPSLDPQVLGPGHHPPAKPKLKAHPTNRLLNDSELISLLTQVVASRPEDARPWSPDDDMEVEDLLMPFNWADHYGPQHGSVLDFMLSSPDVFEMLPDGSLYHRAGNHKIQNQTEATAPPQQPQQAAVARPRVPAFGTFPPAGGPAQAGTPSPVPIPATLVVTPMPGAAPGRTPAPPATPAASASNGIPKHPNKPPPPSAKPADGQGQSATSGRPSATAAPKQDQSRTRPDSRGRSRRGYGGQPKGQKDNAATQAQQQAKGQAGKGVAKPMSYKAAANGSV